MPELSRKKELQQRLEVLKRERQPFEDYWRALIKGLDPRKEKFVDESMAMTQGSNRGSITERHDKDILNNRVKQARRIAVSGMFAGTVNPARPYFKMETEDPALMKIAAVREWVFISEEKLRRKLLASNFYQAVIPFIEELLDFSTAYMTDIVDGDGMPLFETHPLGSYYLAQNRRGEVDTGVIRRDMTARQLFQAYGRDNLSPQVIQALDTNDLERSFTIIHYIEPNADYQEGALESKFKKFRATTFDPSDPSDNLLEDRGYDDFPGYGVRWATVGNETYGTGGPGMVALGDTNQLQDQEEKKARAIEIMVDPLLKGPPDLKNLNIPNNRSNGLIVYDDMGAGNKLEPVYQVDPRIQELTQDMLGIERRIEEAYFVNLFQSISSMQGVQPRNQQELAFRNEESMLVLGPMLQRFQREFLSKMLDRNFSRMAAAGEFPDPPEELEGQELEIRFISTLAQAQRSTEAAANERFLAVVAGAAQLNPQAIDKLDVDDYVDRQGVLTGVNPSLIKDNETVEEERKARAEVARAQMEAEQAQKQASANAQNAQAVNQVAQTVSRAEGGGE